MRALLAVVALAACEKKEPEPKPPTLLDGIELPRVQGTGYRPVEVHVPLVAASKTGIAFDGKAVVALVNGDAGAADKEGGAMGMKIHRLSTALAVHLDYETRPPLQLALDRSLTYGLLVEIMFSAKQREAGWKTFELLASGGGAAVVAMPIALPDKAPPASAVSTSLGEPDVVAGKLPTKPIKACYKALLRTRATAAGKVVLSFGVDGTGGVHEADAHGFDADLDACIEKAMPAWKFPGAGGDSDLVHYRVTLKLVPDDAPGEPPAVEQAAIAPPPDLPLGLVVSVHQDELLLWSFSQLEGSLQEPKLRVKLTDATALEQLGGALAEIVKRRWPSARPDDTKAIVFLADRATSMQRVAEVIGALRPSFPELRFSTGFE